MAKSPVKVEFSPRYRAVQKRIENLPKTMGLIHEVHAKRLAIELIETFKEGIRRGNFRLLPLIEPTIARKRELGQRRPRTRLYGEGDDEENSYINALRIRKVKNGYRVAPTAAREHDADIKLKDLFNVHEYGATITVTPRMRAFLHTIGIHLSKQKTAIRIPPRPAFFSAHRRLLIRMSRRDPAAEVRRALWSHVHEGKDQLLKAIIKKDPNWGKYDEGIG